MEIYLWSVTAIMALIIIALLIKIRILQKSAKEIEDAFADRLTTDTNTLIDLSSRDKYMRSLANSINIQLRELRREHHRFCQGDAELKNAITNISHDLRTPLTAICGYLDLLKQEEMPDEARRYIWVIRNRAEIMMQLTEELFRYSIILSNESEAARRPVVINHILEESIAAFYTALREKGIVPDIHITEKKVVRTLDASALARVFSNLLNNAVKYSDGDLEIILSEAGEVVFSNKASGLNEVQVGKLFERFYTVEAARKSTGLGLAIARALVERMDGTISAEYGEGRLKICIRFANVDMKERYDYNEGVHDKTEAYESKRRHGRCKRTPF